MTRRITMFDSVEQFCFWMGLGMATSRLGWIAIFGATYGDMAAIAWGAIFSASIFTLNDWLPGERVKFL